MSSIAIALIVFGCVFSGALAGMVLRTVLPDDHLNAEAKDVVKVSVALIATLGALVLGLLISSAKSAYDTRNSELLQLSTDVVTLDRVLARYGSEAKDARAFLRQTVAGGIERFWPTEDVRPAHLSPAGFPLEVLYDKIQQLTPQTDSQRSIQSNASKMTTDLGHGRFLLLEQMGSSIPFAFLIIIIFWMTIIFLSFGLFSPINATVITILLLCALSVTGAIFLILELDRSFEGTMQVSSAPLRQALARLGQ